MAAGVNGTGAAAVLPAADKDAPASESVVAHDLLGEASDDLSFRLLLTQTTGNIALSARKDAIKSPSDMAGGEFLLMSPASSQPSGKSVPGGDRLRTDEDAPGRILGIKRGPFTILLLLPNHGLDREYRLKHLVDGPSASCSKAKSSVKLRRRAPDCPHRPSRPGDRKVTS